MVSGGSHLQAQSTAVLSGTTGHGLEMIIALTKVRRIEGRIEGRRRVDLLCCFSADTLLPSVVPEPSYTAVFILWREIQCSAFRGHSELMVDYT